MDFLQSLSQAFADDAPASDGPAEEHTSPSLSVPLSRGRAWLQGQLSRQAFEEDLALQIRQFETCVQQLQEARERSQDQEERKWLEESQQLCDLIADLLDEYMDFQTVEELESIKEKLLPRFDRLLDLQRLLNQRALEQQPPEAPSEIGSGSSLVSPDLYQLHQLLSHPDLWPQAHQHLERMLAKYRQACQLLQQQSLPLKENAQGLLSSLNQLRDSLDRADLQSLQSDFESVVEHYQGFCRQRDAH